MSIISYPPEAFTAPIRRFKRMTEAEAYIQTLGLDPSSTGTLPIFGVDASAKSGAKKYIVGGFIPLWKHIKRFTSQNKGHFYEMLQPKVPMRLFFDIDRKAPFETFDSDVQHIVASVKRCYLADVSSDVSKIRLDPVTLDASTPAKHSRHLIFEEMVFENMEQVKIFVDLVTTDLLTEHPTRSKEGAQIMGIDPAVYTKGRLFRIIGSSKKNKKPHTPFQLVDLDQAGGLTPRDFFRTLVTPFRSETMSHVGRPSDILECIPIQETLCHIKRRSSPTSDSGCGVLKRARIGAFEFGRETVKFTTSEWDALLRRCQRCLSRRHPSIKTFYPVRQGDTLEFILSPGIPCPNNGDVAHRSNKTWFKVHLKSFWGGYTCCDPGCSHHSWGRQRYREMIVNSFARKPQN